MHFVPLNEKIFERLVQEHLSQICVSSFRVKDLCMDVYPKNLVSSSETFVKELCKNIYPEFEVPVFE